MSKEHLLDVLIKCFLCPKFQNIYAGRWDVWLIQHGYMYEYAILIMKTDDQLERVKARAKYEAEEIKSSPLYKALL